MIIFELINTEDFCLFGMASQRTLYYKYMLHSTIIVAVTHSVLNDCDFDTIHTVQIVLFEYNVVCLLPFSCRYFDKQLISSL